MGSWAKRGASIEILHSQRGGGRGRSSHRQREEKRKRKGEGKGPYFHPVSFKKGGDGRATQANAKTEEKSDGFVLTGGKRKGNGALSLWSILLMAEKGRGGRHPNFRCRKGWTINQIIPLEGGKKRKGLLAPPSRKSPFQRKRWNPSPEWLSQEEGQVAAQRRGSRSDFWRLRKREENAPF